MTSELVPPVRLVADVGTAASVRTADATPPSVDVAPAIAVTLLSDVLAPVVGAPVVRAPVAAAAVPADPVPDDERLLPLPDCGPDDVVALRCVVVLVGAFAVGFGLAAAGGRVLGAAPAPNAHPSTLPALGRYEPAPVVL